MMGQSIMVEVNEYIQSQIKRELTGEELIIMTLTLKYIVENDIKPPFLNSIELSFNFPP